MCVVRSGFGSDIAAFDYALPMRKALHVQSLLRDPESSWDHFKTMLDLPKLRNATRKNSHFQKFETLDT
jgi:hypothetical protein